MTLINILLGLIGLTVIVAIHEWGHLTAAVHSKVDVEIFSLGWGPRLFQFRRKNILYQISLLPLGGYCKLKGEKNLIQALDKNMDTIPRDPGDLYAAPPLSRIGISLAGPVANFLLAVLFFCLTALIGYEYQNQDARIVLASHVVDENKEWPSDRAGLMDGDVILSMNNRKISQYNDIRNEALLWGSRPMTLEINRNGIILEKELEPIRDSENGSGILGVYPWINPRFKLSREIDDTRLRTEDIFTLISLNDTKINHYFDILDAGESITKMRIETADNQSMEIVFPESLSIEEFQTLLNPVYEQKEFRLINPFKAFVYGLNRTKEVLYSSVVGIKRLFSGINVSENISGPIRISLMAGEMASSAFSLDLRTGITTSLQFLAFISAALGFMNLLPISLLDGGQVLIYLWEIISRKEIKPKTLYHLQLAGFAVVILLLLFSFGNDIIFLIQHRGSI